jgi:internalin A
LRPSGASSWKRNLVGQTLQLHLYCQQPGEWHPAKDGGIYDINDPAPWLRTAMPYLSKLFGVLKYAAPIAGAYLGTVPQPEAYTAQFKNNVKLMEELLKALPNLRLKDDKHFMEHIEHADARHFEGAPLRAIRRLLQEKDPNQHWGGLKKVITPEGHHLWLCDHHAQTYKI